MGCGILCIASWNRPWTKRHLYVRHSWSSSYKYLSRDRIEISKRCELTLLFSFMLYSLQSIQLKREKKNDFRNLNHRYTGCITNIYCLLAQIAFAEYTWESIYSLLRFPMFNNFCARIKNFYLTFAFSHLIGSSLPSEWSLNWLIGWNDHRNGESHLTHDNFSKKDSWTKKIKEDTNRTRDSIYKMP